MGAYPEWALAQDTMIYPSTIRRTGLSQGDRLPGLAVSSSRFHDLLIIPSVRSIHYTPIIWKIEGRKVCSHLALINLLDW